MENQAITPRVRGGVNRRTLVKGSAWAVPVVAVGAASPAMAASPEPGLNGWVVISRDSDCQWDWSDWGWKCTCYVRYDGYRNGDATYDGVRLGLWVWDAHSSEITEQPSLNIHLPYQVSWQSQSGNSGWSLPTPVGQDSDGFYLYRSTYTGGYVDQTGPDGLPEVVLTGRPHFLGSRSGSCPTDRRQKITRRVGINGEIIQFTREVSFPGNFNSMVQPQAEQDAVQPEADLDSAQQTAQPAEGDAPTPPEGEAPAEGDRQVPPPPVEDSVVEFGLS